MHISQHISEGTTTKTLLGNIGLTRYRSDIIVHCYSYYYIGQHNWRNQCSNTAIFNVAYDVFFASIIVDVVTVFMSHVQHGTCMYTRCTL